MIKKRKNKINPKFFPIKKDLITLKYNDYDNFELLPSAYNGNINIPVTIEKDTIYLASQLLYGEVSVRFVGYNMDRISTSSLDKKINSHNFASTFSTEYSIVSFSRLYPITNKMKAFINAYYSCVKYYECLFTQLGRVGIYNLDHDLIFFVNIEMTNSYWDEPFIFFGNASDGVLPLTSVDICSHELTHGLIDCTLDLEYRGEAGALNESIADMFGIYVEHYINSSVDIPDWMIGEESFKGGCIRNFEDPLSKNQPDVYMGRYWVKPDNFLQDNGGVHTNSGVTNFFCYLCVQGKTKYKTSLGQNVNILKIASEQFSLGDFIKIIYNILTTTTNKSLTMSAFGREFLDNAKALGYSSDILMHVEDCLSISRIHPNGIISNSTMCCG